MMGKEKVMEDGTPHPYPDAIPKYVLRASTERVIAQFRQSLLDLFLYRVEEGLTMQEFADRLSITFEEAEKMLFDHKLTLRSIADITYALDARLSIEVQAKRRTPDYEAS